MLKLLREEQGESEIAEQQNGKDQSDKWHNNDWHELPQLVAGLDV
jgi:hypothetical protein